MPSSGIDLEQTPVSPSEANAALEAVLHSSQFERSERLQRFLRFICETTLHGESQRINEYLIGSEVFQRGSDYSPSEDSIVRRQAHALRQKLQEYYAHDGQSDEVRIELPVGRYVPVFRRVPTVSSPTLAQLAEAVAAASQPAVPAPAATPTETPAPPPPSPYLFTQPRLAILAIALLCFGGLIGYVLRPAPRSGAIAAVTAQPATDELWSPWFEAGSDAVICFSNPQTAVIKHFAKPLSPDTQPVRYRLHPEDEKRVIDAFHLPQGEFIYYTPVINQTKVGEAIAGVHLAGLLTRRSVPVRTTQSRFLS